MKNKLSFFIQNSWYSILLVMIFFLGVYLRTSIYIANNVFEDDECRLAIALLKAVTYKDLFLPLDAGQSAPPIFAVCSKLLSMIFGFKEQVLKLIPFVAGITGIFVFYKICSEYFTKKTSVLLSCFILASSRILIIYSSVFKQYSLDILICLLCLYFFPKININKINKKQFLMLAFSLILLPLTSLPSLFFIGAFFIQNIINNFKNKEFYKKIIVISIPFILSLGLYYIFNLHQSQINMNEAYPGYWDCGFCKPTLNSILVVLGYGIKYMFIPNNIILFPLILFFIGIFFCIKDKDNTSIFIVLTCLLVLIASLLKIYPFLGRVSLYFVGILIILIIKPFDKIQIKSPIGVIICLMLFLSFIKYNYTYFKHASDYETYCKYSPEILLKELQSKFNPDKDIILSNNASVTSFIFYASKLHFDTDKIYEMDVISANKEASINYLNQLPPNNNYWFYMVKDFDKGKVYPILLEWLENNNAQLIKKHRESYLYYLEK